MSLDKAFRDMIRAEVEAQLKPLQQAVRDLQAGMGSVEQMRAAAEALVPMANLFSGMKGAPAASLPRRGPGRPRAAAATAGEGKRRGRRPAETSGQPCAIKGCGKPSRTKGYCAAHYQKLRMLERTDRRPAEWKDYAPPDSVQDVKLPRGRAASKALREAQKQKQT